MNKNSFYFLLIAMVSLFLVGCINDNATYRQMVLLAAKQVALLRSYPTLAR